MKLLSRCSQLSWARIWPKSPTYERASPSFGYATNHANTGAVDDGDELAWAQYGTALLIGDGHAAAAVQYLNAHPETERGTLRVERGSVQYPRGRLRVVGCSQQDDFKTAVRAGGSQKHISFRDE